MPFRVTPTVTLAAAFLAAFVAALVGFAPLRADTVSAGDPRLPAAVVDGVRGEIGAAWGVEPERVVLRWNLPTAMADASPDAFRVLGSGAGGQWIVELRTTDGIQRLSLRAGVVVPVWVAARELPRDHVVAEGDLVLGQEERWGPPSADEAVAGQTIAGLAPHLGWQVRRRIPAGEPVSPPAVSPPSLFQAGDAVAVQVQRGRVSVEIVGEARSAGIQGGEARVRLPSGRVVTGTVVSGNRITLKEGS